MSVRLCVCVSVCVYMCVCVCVCVVVVVVVVVCPVGSGCRIHRLLLCRGVRPPPNECPRYDTKQPDGDDTKQPAGALGNAEYPFIAIAPRSTLARSGST